MTLLEIEKYVKVWKIKSFQFSILKKIKIDHLRI